MKTPEDEAFDELARKQGAWGDGYQAKRQMAADKMQEPVCDKDPQGCWNVRCQLGKQCKNLAQPAQEPVAYVTGVYGGRFTYEPLNRAIVLPTGMALYSTPQHTATWVGLTDEERQDIALEVPMDAVFITEAKLKEKNT